MPKRKLAADRLLQLLQRDLAVLERDAEREDGDEASGARASGTVKGRVEAVEKITRTLEKLIDLKRLETLALTEASAEDERETERLRRELMRRLRAVDRRRGGAELVGPAGEEEAAT